MSSARKTILPWLLAVVCLVALLLALRWYQDQYQRPFDDRPTLFSGASLQLPAALAGPGPVRVVHFWDPACPCNVGNQQHLVELLQRYAGEEVVFYSLQKPGSRGRLPAPLASLKPLSKLVGAEGLPASPAVAVWDQQGQLAYFGPYSEGAVCTSANSFIEPVIDALLQGRSVRATQTLSSGCFCSWPE